jgi:hypothetical protein
MRLGFYAALTLPREPQAHPSFFRTFELRTLDLKASQLRLYYTHTHTYTYTPNTER